MIVKISFPFTTEPTCARRIRRTKTKQYSNIVYYIQVGCTMVRNMEGVLKWTRTVNYGGSVTMGRTVKYTVSLVNNS